MNQADNAVAREAVERVYETESRRVFATLIRLLGNFDLAEEALHEAFAAALAQWSSSGVPDNPRAWLVSAGRFKAIDAIRHRARQDATLTELAARIEGQSRDEAPEHDVSDDRLRLIFTCCHPAISTESQIALTLREVCGLKTEEIASAFLMSSTTLAQRIVRAKSKIRMAGIPYEVPSQEQLPERLEAVLHVIYLVFNEGYAATSGKSLTRSDLSAEAIRLGRLLQGLLPEPEVSGLLALMLLHESRAAARTNAHGEIVLLESQDRGLWNRDMISEGSLLVERSLASGHVGAYALQAAIAAVHAEAADAASTDWAQIVQLYAILLRIEPSPVIELNRAVAVAMRDGPAAGLSLVEDLLARGELSEYHLAHSARGELCRRLGKLAAARESFERALKLTTLEPERKFLLHRLQMVSDFGPGETLSKVDA